MANYFVPGTMPEGVREHFGMWNISVQQERVTQPVDMVGYIVPQQETECQEFLHACGIPQSSFRNAQPTNIRNLLYVGDATSTQVQETGTVSYTGRNPHIMPVLTRFATENNINIQVTGATRDCFTPGMCMYCDREDAEEENGVNDDALQLHFNCAKRGSSSRDSIHRVYGHNIREDEVGLWPIDPTRRGVAIRDPQRTIVAEVENGEIFILFNIDLQRRTIGGNSHWRPSGEVLAQILTEAIPVALSQQSTAGPRIPRYQRIVEQTRARLAASQQETLQQFVQRPSNFSNRIQELEASLERARENATRYYNEWVSHVRSVDDLIAHINGLKLNPHQGQQNREQEYANIHAIPGVIGMEVTRNEVHVYTDTIYITESSTRYRIGSFKITINHTHSRVTIQNLSNPYREGYDHPHISGGDPCLGNISEGVAEAIRNNELEVLITLLLEFLSSYNHSGAYRKVDNWPRVI